MGVPPRRTPATTFLSGDEQVSRKEKQRWESPRGTPAVAFVLCCAVLFLESVHPMGVVTARTDVHCWISIYERMSSVVKRCPVSHLSVT